jgi:cell division protein FtsQ
VAARRPLALAAVALALGAGLVALTRTGAFAVRTIEVRGADHLTRAVVVGLSGITEETNALWLDEGVVESRLEEDAWIADARVSVTLPWTVNVWILERTPVAVVDGGTTRYLLAGDGSVLGSAGRERGLTTIQVPPAWIRVQVGSSVAGAARALDALDERIRGEVRRVVITPQSSLEIVLRDGLRISYGQARSFEDKAAAIAQVLLWAERSGESLRAIDVSAPGAPAAELVG